MDVAMADVMPMKALVSHQYDYGSTTELYLENLGGHGDLVSPLHPWHRGAGGGWRRTRTPGSRYPSATGAGRYQPVMNSPREETECYDNVMSWAAVPIGEPDC